MLKQKIQSVTTSLYWTCSSYCTLCFHEGALVFGQIHQDPDTEVVVK